VFEGRPRSGRRREGVERAERGERREGREGRGEIGESAVEREI